MKLGFDIDEVICALCDVTVIWMKEEFNIDWAVEDFKEFDLTKSIYSEDPEYNEKVTKKLIETICDPEFQITAKPFEGAPAFMRRLRKEGHTIHFITCRDCGAENYSVKWLREYNIPFNSVHHLGNVECEKGMYGRSLNLDFFIDDVEAHLLSMYKYKKRWKKGLMLWTRPWNEDSLDTSKFIRAKKWADISRHLGIHKR
jgi:uncharacterized HAD superfamily protein